MTEDEDMLTIIEAEAKTGISANTLRLAIYRKRLVATKRGRDWYVTLKAIETWRANRDPRGRHLKIHT